MLTWKKQYLGGQWSSRENNDDGNKLEALEKTGSHQNSAPAYAEEKPT